MYFRLSVDDLPLIRPPKHHMLAHVTGGLRELYDMISEDKNSRATNTNKDGEGGKPDDEGGGGKKDEEDDSDYDEEEGLFKT